MSIVSLSKNTIITDNCTWDAHFGKSVLKILLCFTWTFFFFYWWLFCWTRGYSSCFKSLL